MVNGFLSATLTRPDTIAAVDLTALGGVDYLVGRGINYLYNRKVGGTLIGVPTEGFTFDDATDDPTGYSVSGTDGTPTSSFTYTTIYGSFASTGESWSVVISGIGTARRNVKFFAGSRFGNSTVTLTLSDGSTAPITLSRDADGTGGTNDFYTVDIEVNAGSPGQTLTVTFTSAGAPAMYPGWLWVGGEQAGGITGTANQTLQPVTQDASGTVTQARSGIASQTLQPVTQTVAAGNVVGAQANQTLQPVTQDASGTVIPVRNASADQTLQPVTQTTAGSTPHAANASQNLQPVTQDASGTVGNVANASADQNLQPVTQTVAGSTPHAANASQNLQPVTQTVAGSTPHGVNANQTLQPVTQNASGTVVETRVGTANQTLRPVTQTAAGTVSANAQADQTLQPVTQYASGIVLPIIDASADQTLQPVTQDASGTVSANAAAIQFLQNITQNVEGNTGTGTRIVRNPITVYVQPDELISVYNNDGFIVEI